MNLYGVNETNGLIDAPAYHRAHYANHAGTVDWTDPGLKRITRLRLLSDPGFPVWDVSYCHGVMKDGSTCEVMLPFHQLPKRAIWRAILAHAKRDGVYAKGLGIYECISKLC